jgi:uncharacterized membrane protein YdcZ (DUF606 family)
MPIQRCLHRLMAAIRHQQHQQQQAAAATTTLLPVVGVVVAVAAGTLVKSSRTRWPCPGTIWASTARWARNRPYVSSPSPVRESHSLQPGPTVTPFSHAANGRFVKMKERGLVIVLFSWLVGCLCLIAFVLSCV